ncbi:hypothetical protein [Parvibacter caecicola]|uniref:Uncharacterized protein n=1 Tax=Parvibacter caecicola TaxID=747645 RepID=A0A7W5D2M4_9ACTN|nr:hypothetical protein [Parvibacter caecicola]MBB3171787.1 hypothetical protein [Parvibacter caecicola]MCR2040652.1 hypothetical protein [Parvibacter caecicola]RNL10831.1 hypothetical protein DMP11_06180 [Parvibacter caecicola]
MKIQDLLSKLNMAVDAGQVGPNDEVEFITEDEGWNDGYEILNTMAIIDGDGNAKMLLTSFEKVFQ